MYTVSILVPIFNVEQYIERCARSLFEQSYPFLEFVFVNDCTPDKSVDVLHRVMENYPARKQVVKLVNHERNKGVAAARNTLLENATGDFICYVDADDWLEKGAVESLVRKQLETDADIVSGNVFLHYAEGVKELTENELLNKGQRLIRQLKDTWTMEAFIWGRIYRRSLFETNHIRCMQGYNYAEDRYQVIRLFYFANRFSFVDDFVYNYEKRNDASITVLQKNNISAYLRNQYQHLHNWIGIRDFFIDKESEYYQLAVKNTSILLELNLKWTLKYKTKKDFLDIVELIDENEDCMQALGWQNTGVRGFILHNYCCMKVKQLAERSLRFIKKRMRSGKEDID